MTRVLKTSLAALTLLLSARSVLNAQALPTATAAEPRYNPGPTLPMIDGTFHYSLSASELFQTGLNSVPGLSATTNLSGNAEYVSPSLSHPTSLLYSGGILFSNATGQGTQTFQGVTLSQGIVGHGWSAGVSDTFSFLPQSPTTGLIGVPGIGDIGALPISDPSLPAQSVLTNYGKRISNTVSGNVSRRLTGRDSLSGSGSYGTLRFLGTDYTGGQNLNSNQISGSLSLNHQIDRRSSLSISAQYSTFSYGGNSTRFNSRGLSLQYSRTLTRSLSFSTSAGPQWVSAFTAYDPLTPLVVPVPSRLTVQATAGLSYVRRSSSANLAYSRGVNSGSGVQTGAISDSISASVQRSFNRDWAGSLSGAYTRTSGLVNTDISSVFGGVQVNRRLTNNLSAFAGYTGIHQSYNNTLATRNAFNGFSQVFSIGITFSPRQSRLGQF
jgi:hypothetical protein